VGPKNHVLGEGPNPPRERDNYGEGCFRGSVTKGRFPLIPGVSRKEGYVVGAAAGDGVADVVEARLNRRRRFI